MKKRIVLGLPKSFSLYKVIKENMEFYGYEVISISYDDHQFEYKNFQQKAYNFLRKTFLRDKHYKNKLKFAFYETDINNTLDTIDGLVDYTFLIRADIFPTTILHRLRAISKNMVAYQWDGLHRFPAIYSHIPLFDRFFVFDKNDLNYSKSKVLPITNFYFDFDTNFIKKEDCENDVFFVGSYIKRRNSQIETFIKKAVQLNLKLDFNIFIYSNIVNKLSENTNINFFYKHMSYKENITRLKKSKIIVDFLNSTHEGLSFRTFEALYYNKKLITNNNEVKKYDFYNPNNIFVWDGKNLDGLEEFVEAPYIMIDKDIKLKYGFKNWLKYIFDIKGHTPIKLPK